MLSALGLSKNEIPLHVYKMREYGYPSGWLEEAKVEYSGISIFTAPNQRKLKLLINMVKIKEKIGIKLLNIITIDFRSAIS